MVESFDSGTICVSSNSTIVPPNQFDASEGKSILIGVDVPDGAEKVGWVRDGRTLSDHSDKAGGQPRFRSFERLLSGESSVNYDCFLAAARLVPSSSSPGVKPTIRAYLAIDSLTSEDAGTYELVIRTKSQKAVCIVWAATTIRVTTASPRTPDAKRRKVNTADSLSSELPTVHYPHPMAPVFVRTLPDKVYIDAGDTVQLGCRLWGLPSNLVNWTDDPSLCSDLLLTKATATA